ncbi:hypothetical protein AV521_23625 [Streptomyces sp. IMTB 2501]|uniref:hypothetical protein n=1 Tax=Streptomyces sp. IMTB 2501 TaxID=1776340 RepID=UPI00096D4044|nr:hypothetical protein [Streptomyces sp. IMTB 2501]OLZ67865.1 hypothetical protein AV521_23625 [Streptomyces sp. IMTB 2501]
MAITGKFTYKRGGEVRDIHYPTTDREKFILHWEGGSDPHELRNDTSGWVALYHVIDGKEHFMGDPTFSVVPPGRGTSWGGGGPDLVRAHVKDPAREEE